MNFKLIIGILGTLIKLGVKIWNKKAREDAKNIIGGIGRLDNDSMRDLLKRV